MKVILISDSELVEDAADEELVIQAWRAEQLRRLGLSRTVAETFAALVDWHEVAALVARGCSPELALEIAR
jgi:predicted transcriptional regulator